MDEKFVNEEIIEKATEEIATASSGSGKFYKVAAIGLAALATLATYKVTKMIINKIKNNHQEIDEEPIDEDDEFDEDDDDEFDE